MKDIQNAEAKKREQDRQDKEESIKIALKNQTKKDEDIKKRNITSLTEMAAEGTAKELIEHAVKLWIMNNKSIKFDGECPHCGTKLQIGSPTPGEMNFKINL